MKAIAVFGAAAALTIGAAFTSMAAWQQEGDTWIYTDSNGGRRRQLCKQDDQWFQVFEVGGRLYLVKESGRVQDSSRGYRSDGEYRYEYDNGTIYQINGNRERLGEVTSGERLPGIAYQAVYTLYGSAE